MPQSWKHYKEPFGRFEVWLPKGWESIGSIRTVVYSLHEIVEGSESPLLFGASGGDMDGFQESLVVNAHNTAFELYAPLVGIDLVKECSRNNPVELTGEFDGVIYLDASNVVTIELDEGRNAIAYQSTILGQSSGKNLVRTVACAVSRNYVYLIYLDTIEENDSVDIPTCERVLKAFRTLE